jgi:hypothetical protein
MITNPANLVKKKTEKMFYKTPFFICNQIWILLDVSLKILKFRKVNPKVTKINFSEKIENYGIFFYKNIINFFQKKIFIFNISGKNENLIPIINKETIGIENFFSSKFNWKSNSFFSSFLEKINTRKSPKESLKFKNFSFFSIYFFSIIDNSVFCNIRIKKKLKYERKIKNFSPSSINFKKICKTGLSFKLENLLHPVIFFKKFFQIEIYPTSIFANQNGIWIKLKNKQIKSENYEIYKKKIDISLNLTNIGLILSNFVYSFTSYIYSDEFLKKVSLENNKPLETIVEGITNHSFIFIADNPVKIIEKESGQAFGQLKFSKYFSFNDFESFLCFQDKFFSKKKTFFSWAKKNFFFNTNFTTSFFISPCYNFYNMFEPKNLFIEISCKNLVLIKSIEIQKKINSKFKNKKFKDLTTYNNFDFQDIFLKFSSSGKSKKYYKW